MSVVSLGDKVPAVDPSAWVNEAAYVVGDVRMGAGSSAWPGAVIRGDFGPIVIGANTHIEDNSVVHADYDGLDIGDDVIVGHAVVVHCHSIGNNCLIGSNATLLDGVRLPAFCVVAAGSVVLEGAEIPEGSMLVGSPAVVRPAGERHIARLRRQSDTSVGYGAMVAEYRRLAL